ncbi:hypothetical protein BYT27DRAFT_7227460 [Phlegmacium glaucopus]|nr:hypothetical protein BYT27DRAFT_7227460 [Phlegmacium glaucopus]
MTSIIAAETAALTIARFAIFFSCRKHLLRIFYSDLHSPLSPLSNSVPGTPDATITIKRHKNIDFEETIQLDSLPLPSTTHSPKSPKFPLNNTTYLHAAVSRIMFSWCFTESCMMFFLLMLQEFGVFSASTRLLNWKFSLFFILLCILVIIPFAISLLLTIGNLDRRAFQRPMVRVRAFLSLIPVIIYLFALSHIPLPAALASSDTATIALSRLIVLGTIILGLLSGFGAISNSWRFLPFISQPQGVPSENELDAAQYALTGIRNDLRLRREEAARREGSSACAETTSWFSRVGSSFRGGDSLNQELEALQVLEHDMTLNLETLRELRSIAQYSQTLKGRIINFGRRIFAVYCMIRIGSSIYNVFFRPSQRSSSTKSYPDLITNLLSYLFSLRNQHMSSPPPGSGIDVNADPGDTEPKVNDYDYEDLASKLARQLSLILVGIIILSSIRVVLRGVTRVLRVSSRTLAASLMLLVLAQIMGIYLLSTIVQMRASFPPPPTVITPSTPEVPSTTVTTTTNLFSTIPAYEVFGSLFDWTLLISAGASLLINYVRWGVET